MSRSLFFLFASFSIAISSYGQKLKLVDSKATTETRNLFANLKALSNGYTLFGHQHATEYGHGWSGEEGRSDVKSVTGSHPAVIGVDLSGFSGQTAEVAKWSKNAVRKNIVDTYNRGGVTTIAWHFNNPVSKGGFYWVDSLSLPAVKYLIPGGEAHEKYKEILKDIGEWALTLKGADDKLVPVIFRPYHEFDGGWFWWGAPHCTKDEFVALWRFTVSYLRDTIGVHNFIYAFSPDNRFNSDRMSKLFLYQWHRDGQLPYASMVRNVDHGDAVILHCQQWIADNYQRQDIIAEMVRQSGLPKRSFDRRFRAGTGFSPLAYVQTLRIEEAKQLLETRSVPVEQVGREVGYEDAASFRRLFRRLTGIGPSDYRRKFQPPALVSRANEPASSAPLRVAAIR